MRKYVTTISTNKVRKLIADCISSSVCYSNKSQKHTLKNFLMSRNQGRRTYLVKTSACKQNGSHVSIEQ